MEKQNLYLIIGVLAGVLIGIFSAGYAVNSRSYQTMNTMGMGRGAMYMMQADECPMMSSDEGHGMDMSMSQMSSNLATLRGDEFDQTFLEQMIDHHQGAIDMANLVLENSQRPELRTLANDIVLAQEKEIEMMKGWLEAWFGE